MKITGNDFTQAEGMRTGMPKTKAKGGFTLAEVVITLGIIGVVAAMTIPALNTNIRRKTASARLKTFYSTMKQMLLLAEDEHGSVNNWDTSLSYPDFIETYFLPYLKATKGTKNNKIYFMNGSSIELGKGQCMDIHFDYNSDGPPNKAGYDRFLFLICEQGSRDWCGDEGFCGYRTSGTINNRELLLTRCRTNPDYCSGLLEHDHWEFLPDYPW